MYCEYFGFLKRPFELTPDPAFLYLGEAHREGLATLDSFDALAATGAPRKLYVTWHMNEAGNRLIAGLVAEALQ